MYNIQKSTKEFVEFTSTFQTSDSDLVLSNMTYAELVNTGTFQVIDNHALRDQISIYYNHCEVIKLELAGHNKKIADMIVNAASRTTLLKYKIKAQDPTLLDDVDNAFDKKDWEFINDPRSIEFRLYEEVVYWHYVIHLGFIPPYESMNALSEELILAIENELLILN